MLPLTEVAVSEHRADQIDDDLRLKKHNKKASKYDLKTDPNSYSFLLENLIEDLQWRSHHSSIILLRSVR